MTQDPRITGPAQQTPQTTQPTVAQPAPNAPLNAPAAPNAPRTQPATSGSFKKALPILALLAIWVIGGFITYQVGSVYGWNQGAESLRTGTMQIKECHPDPARLFVAQRCTGTATFAPENTWSAQAQKYLKDRKTVALVSRGGVKGNVPFTCYNTKSSKHKQGFGHSYAPVEECHPTAQVPQKAKVAAPLISGLVTALLGLGVCALLLRLITKPEMEREKAAQASI